MVSWPSLIGAIKRKKEHNNRFVGKVKQKTFSNNYRLNRNVDLIDKESEGYLDKRNESVTRRPTDPTFSYINVGEEDEMEIHGYHRSKIKSSVTYFFIFITIGILRLVYHWFPEWFLNCTHSKCSLESAKTVLVVVGNPRSFSLNRSLDLFRVNRNYSRRNIAACTFFP